MVIVSLRERRQRQVHTTSVPGTDVQGAVTTALTTLYGQHTLLAPVTTAGTHARLVERETLLARYVVITVRVQGELFDELG